MENKEAREITEEWGRMLTWFWWTWCKGDTTLQMTRQIKHVMLEFPVTNDLVVTRAFKSPAMQTGAVHCHTGI